MNQGCGKRGEATLAPGGPLRALFSALAFLTVIPVPERWKTGRENGMFGAFPFAGLLIGGVLCAAAAGAAWLFPPAVAAVVLAGLSVLLTGAIHLDGLADCADAFYGRRDRKDVLRILKDPRVGTMGAAAVGLSLLLRAASFLSIPTGMLLPALPVAAMFARAAVLPAMALLPYVRGESGIISAGAARGAGRTVLAEGRTVLGAAAALIAMILLPLPVAAALAGLALFWRLSWKKMGGCTGDVLGATIEIGEVLFFLALAATEKAGLTWGLVYPLLSPR